MGNQESQQATVFVPKFNEMKKELQNLTLLMTVMMRKFDSQFPSPVAHDS